MKKTLITLLALGGLAMGAESVLFTSTNSVSNTAGGFEAQAFAFNLSGSAFTTTSTPSGETFPDEVLLLESITLQTRDSGSANKTGKYYLVVTDTSFNVIACSNEKSDAGTFTWSFSSNDAPVTIDSNTTYFVIAQAESVQSGTTLVTDSEMMNLATTGLQNYGAGNLDFNGADNKYSGLQFINILDSNNDGKYDAYDYNYNNQSTQYAPNVTIVTRTIPEPATATLSLLALAGLAARRRRK